MESSVSIRSETASLAGLDIFESAQVAFLQGLKDPAQAEALEQHDSPAAVLTQINSVLQEKSRGGIIRNIGRIRPYIDALNQFSAVIEVFIQAKPEILCLVWGPIKLILQFSSSVTKALDKIVEAFGHIGRTLPQFQRYATLFDKSDEIKKVMGFFYVEILELHVTILNFFKRHKWNMFFECFWPKTSGKIDLIRGHIKQLSDSLESEVKFEDIFRAHMAREAAYKEYLNDHEIQDQLRFEACHTSMAPRLYDEDLEKLCRQAEDLECWLLDLHAYRSWKKADTQHNCGLWLQGIPGAGKTILTGKMVRSMLDDKRKTYFAFFSYADVENGTCIRFLHSMIFQVLFDEPNLRPAILQAYTTNYRKLKSDPKFVMELFMNLITDSDRRYLVADGLDELPANEREHLLKNLLQIMRECPNVSVFLSSRVEKDITDALICDGFATVRVDENNSKDIELFVHTKSDKIIENLRSFGAGNAVCSQVRSLLTRVTQKAQGMFLYAQLMMEILAEVDSPSELEDELTELPDGLEQAYGRIADRIRHMKRPKEREMARKILHWIGCAKTPLREEELLQALAIDSRLDYFKNGQTKSFRDVCKTCGPIIEIKDGCVKYVHFTAKEYLFGPQGRHFLTRKEANLEAASTTVAYLSFKHVEQVTLNLERDEMEIQQQIIQGSFVLLPFATQNMISYVRESLWVYNTLEELEQLLFSLIARYTEEKVQTNAQPKQTIVWAGQTPLTFWSLQEKFRSLLSHPGDLEAFNLAVISQYGWSARTIITQPVTRDDVRALLTQFLGRPPRSITWPEDSHPTVDAANDLESARPGQNDWHRVHHILIESESHLAALRTAQKPVCRSKLISELSSALGRVQRLAERILCPPKNHKMNCQCARLKALYGSRLYKCYYYHCPMFRDGFDSELQRNEHLSTHSQYSMDPKGLIFNVNGGDDDDDDDDHHDDRPRAGRNQHSQPESEARAQEEIVYSSTANYSGRNR